MNRESRLEITTARRELAYALNRRRVLHETTEFH